MPNDLDAKLLALLLVVDGQSPNYTIQLGHEKSPISALEHREAAIVKALNLLGWWFVHEIDLEILFPLFEPSTVTLSFPIIAHLNGFDLHTVVHLNDFFANPSIQEDFYNRVTNLQGIQLLLADLFLVTESVDK